MKIASIDIGSNTVLLLIAEIKNGSLFPLYNQYETPRLGKGLKPGGEILEGKVDQLIKILTEFKIKIEEFRCNKTILTATNAMRLASNSEEIIKLVKNKLDFEIKIIQGEEEARLSFLGAGSAFPEIDDKVVIDIGGGSTEIIYGNKKNIHFRHSFQVGTVSLTEKFIKSFPYQSSLEHDIFVHLSEIFSPLIKAVPNSLPTIAVAGTPTTLYCMSINLKNYDEKIVERSKLTINELKKLSNKLLQLDPFHVKEQFGPVVYGREDVILAGSLILQFLANLKLVDSIYISGRGLRYGNIVDYIK